MYVVSWKIVTRWMDLAKAKEGNKSESKSVVNQTYPVYHSQLAFVISVRVELTEDRPLIISVMYSPSAAGIN